MKVKALIDRLKAQVATLGSPARVAGSAEFEEATQRTDLTLPCAFVMRMQEVPSVNEAMARTLQVVEEQFAVIVCVSNATDQKGFAGGEAQDDIKADLLSALLGWVPDADHNPMEYRGAHHLAQDRAKLWFQYDFATESVVSNL